MNLYLNKYGFIKAQLNSSPASATNIIVVIPCFNEPNILPTLQALSNCQKTKCNVEVIVVVNSSEDAPESILAQNKQTCNTFHKWKQDYKGFINFELISVPDLPKKHAGVGLARKIGMDEAVARFDSLVTDGIIVCFDADSTCSENYLVAIEQHFNDFPNTPGCSIAFEHPLEGDEFSSEIYAGIANYELHLRYYNQCLRIANLPYAYHTVGSSMAVKSSAYQKQGGMNKRKAGEDFYFIHKIIALGGFTELKSAKVYPSPRISNRVPFGTGKAIGDWIEKGEQTYYSYNLRIFEEIRNFLFMLPSLYDGKKELVILNNSFITFLNQQQLQKNIQQIKANTKGFEAFEKRFFAWFDAFMVLKAVHFLRDTAFPNQDLVTNSRVLLSNLGHYPSAKNPKDLLLKFRDIENN